MGGVNIEVPLGQLKVSPGGFRKWARHFYKCHLDFESPDPFSPLPFFLCCRAIELAFKAKHLETKNQIEVKNYYSHDLVKAYTALDPNEKNLSEDELVILTDANDLYTSKDFEYMNLWDFGTGFKRFPDLTKLDALARKIVEYDA